MRTKERVLIGLAVLVAASALAMSGSSGADPYLDVHTLTDDPAAHEGRVVSVKGTVVANSTITEGDTVRFVLSDASGDPEHVERNLTVHYTGVLPDAFGPKMVVVTGELAETPQGLRLIAEAIQVGCSSKY